MTDPLVERLRAAGCVFAEDEAALLRASARTPAALELLVERRVGGEPLEQVLGWAELAGVRVTVAPGVFVPRRRTGLLAREAVRLAGAGAVVVDVCCGSGAVGAVVATAVPDVELHATDVDPAAVACARRNLEPLGGVVHEGDLLAGLPQDLQGRVDVLVSSPPYVPSPALRLMPPEARLHEPRAALDGGRDGLDPARRLVAAAPEWLAPGGHLLVETSREQGPVLAAAAEAAGLPARVVVDDDLDATAVVAPLSRRAG